MLYPNDANGDVLRRMEARGDDLTKPRNIDFTVVFADASSAAQFAEHFRGLGHKVSVELTETNRDFPWDVVVVEHMAPSMMRSRILRIYCNRWQTVGEGTTMGGVVSRRHVSLKWAGWLCIVKDEGTIRDEQPRSIGVLDRNPQATAQ